MPGCWFSGGFWAGGTEGAGVGEGMEEEGVDGGAALEGRGGWDMEIEVVVPVKPSLLPAMGVGGV